MTRRHPHPRRPYGQGLIEYGLGLALIAIIAVGVIFITGHRVSSSLCQASGGLEDRYAAAVKADTPLVYLHVGGGAGATEPDASGNGHTATYSGTRAAVPGPLQCVQGDTATRFTTNGGLTFPGTAALVTPAVTIEAWFQYNGAAFGGWPYIFGPNSHAEVVSIRKTNTGNPPYGDAAVFAEWGRPPFDGSSFASGTIMQAAAANDGNWHYVAVTWDGTTMTLYADGVRTNAGTINSGNSPAPQPWYLGQNWNGAIAEAAAYDHALSAATVLQHYQIATGQA